MKVQHKYCPDFRDCVLEDRLVPVIPNQLGSFLAPVVPNLGAIVLTPAGYDLMSSFPGIAIPAYVRRDGLGGNLQHAAGQRHRRAGPGRDVAERIERGGRSTIFVGSGANDVVATIIPLVTRNTIANDALNAAPLIGRVLGDRSDVFPPEQVYRGGLPVSASGASRRRRPANGPGRIRMRGPSFRCRFGSRAGHAASHRCHPAEQTVAMPQSSHNRPTERRNTNMGSTDDHRWEPANGAGRCVPGLHWRRRG